MIAPGTPEWLTQVTPSKVPAILGVSRFKSQFTMWHEMAGLVEPAPVDAALQGVFDAGHAFEHALAALYRIEHPDWRLSPGEVQIGRDDLGFPTVATIDRRATRGRGRRVVEFKTVRSFEDWGDTDGDQIPVDYAAQVMWQMHVTGWTTHPAHLLVMGPFFRWFTYEIPYDPEVAGVIEQRCAAWWSSIQSGTPPALDDSVSTYQTVRALHPDIDGSSVELDPAVADEYIASDQALKAAEKWARGAKTRVLAAMGRAETAMVGEQRIAKRIPHHSGAVSLRRNPKTNNLGADAEPMKETA